MRILKATAFAALLASAMVLPVVGAQAEGMKSESKAGTTASSQSFSALDTDKSGSLSEAEFNQAANTTVEFDEADANSDGKITLSELQVTQTSPDSPARTNSMAN